MSNKRKVERSVKALLDAAMTPAEAIHYVEANPIAVSKADQEIAPDDPSGAVAVAFVHENMVDYSFFHSMTQLVLYDLSGSARLARGGFIAIRGSTGNLAADRNHAVLDFLQERKAEWLCWIDSDMGFEPDSIDRLVEAADSVERPVMGGLCFAQREDEADGVGGFRPVTWPVIFDWTTVNEQGGFSIRWDYPRNQVTKCHGVGSAFVLIHRSVFETVREKYVAASKDPQWANWYSRIINPTTGELVGEDLSFCVRLMSAEIPVHVHTGVQTTHRKNIWLQEQDYWRQRALAPAPEAVENLPRERWQVPRFAVVPTHNRPERLKALVAALANQVDEIVVLDNASYPPVDMRALQSVAEPAELVLLRDGEQPPNLARFWNFMFHQCELSAEERGAQAYDVAVLNDDAIVPAGWFDICSTVLRGHETAAVAHTGATPVHRHELLDSYPYPREKRMCPWAFVVKGELGLRADESMRWWFFDDDFCRQAVDAGGVLAAPGPLVINAHAVQSTTGVLAEQAGKDRATFEAKWAGRL